MTNLKTATKFTAKRIAAMAEVAAQFLPEAFVQSVNGELHIICPEETDEMLDDEANYADGGWVGPHGLALQAIEDELGLKGCEVVKFPTWFCIRKNTAWTPGKELVFNNID